MIFGKKIENIRIKPLSQALLFTFISIIVITNLSTNYINFLFHKILLSQNIRTRLANELNWFLDYSENQFRNSKIIKKHGEGLFAIKKRAKYESSHPNIVTLGLKKNGNLLFQTHSNQSKKDIHKDILAKLNTRLKENIDRGFIEIIYKGDKYFTAYRYSFSWKAFLLHGEKEESLYHVYGISQKLLFLIISFIVLVSIFLASFLITSLLHNLNIITRKIIKNLKNKDLQSIKLKKISNDDISLIGIFLNTLLETTTSLVYYFQNQAQKNFRKSELSILSIDIPVKEDDNLEKSFSKLYQKIEERGFHILSATGNTLIVGIESFKKNTKINGLQETSIEKNKVQYFNKSQKLLSMSYELLALSESETISSLGMAGGETLQGKNVLIGKNINFSISLMKLTNIYRVPILCSEYIKNDIQNNIMKHDFYFLELDKVSIGQESIWHRIYWPILTSQIEEKKKVEIQSFHQGLELYYMSQWKEAYKIFKELSIEPALEFQQRTNDREAPRNWNGVWRLSHL